MVSETEKVDLLSFYKDTVRQKFIREDYAELLQLALMCLGNKCFTKFRRPGALHHARWMAKAIYGLKMYLLRSQFTVDSEYETNLLRFVLFVVRIYLKGWYNAPSATSAPSNDLKFVESLRTYGDEEISQTTYKKITNHLWYLSEINVCLALFDDTVDNNVKKAMLANFSKQSDGKNMKRVKKFNPNSKLQDFVSNQSLIFFKIFNVNPDILLKEDPSNWSSNVEYMQVREKCNSLCVINDPAERALGLAGDLNEYGPTSEPEKHEMILAVAKNRKLQNNSLKTSVVEYLTTLNSN